LESVCWGNSTVGSNPTLSAISSWTTTLLRHCADKVIACNCGDECYLARLEHIVVHRIALALDESRYIVQDSMPPRE
jgi:hypothetical protein